MTTFLSIALYVSLAALLVVLGMGIINIARTDEGAASRSNKLMRMRIAVQAVVILVLIGLGIALGAIKFGG